MQHKAVPTRNIVAAVIGNALEWHDFLVFAFMTAIFGGFAQFIVTWLIKTTGSPMAPAYYVMFGVALGLVASFFMRERAHENLDP